jgi:tetratricopeptide (TPR) repeat protein
VIPEPDFPSSTGRPFRAPDATLLERRDEFAAQAHELDAEAATELAARAWRLWMAARDVPGGRAFLAEVLERDGAPRSRWRALALYGDGLFAFWEGDLAASRARNDEALAIAEELDDDEALALAHLGLSRAALEEGDAAAALEHAVAARRSAAEVGEAMGQTPLHVHAQSLRLAGDYDGAARLFGESLALNERIGDQGMVVVEHHNLGHVELHRGNVDAAERHFGALPRDDDALAKLNDAALAFARGDAERARALVEEIGDIELPADDRSELQWLRDRCAAS